MARSASLAAEIICKIKGKVTVVGIGNIMRGDDGLGPKVIELLRGDGLPARLFDCGTAPENYAIPILNTAADTVIFIDAADTGRLPGEISVLDLEEISDVSFSTHCPSPRLFVDLLRTGKEDLNVFFVSVQPKTTSLGAHMSPEVVESIEVVRNAMAEALQAQG